MEEPSPSVQADVSGMYDQLSTSDKTIIIICVSVGGGVCLFATMVYCCLLRARKKEDELDIIVWTDSA